MPELIAGKSKIAVLLGGWSHEREVSLVSGAACASALRDLGHLVEEIDVDRRVAEVLADTRPDACLNILHGRWGEDGCMQGVLETLEIPYSHSGVTASALAMDKNLSKSVFREAGLPLAESFLAAPREIAASHLMNPPYVVKPTNEGSSIGVMIVGTADSPPPLTDSKQSVLMVERYIAGMELTVTVLDGRALEITEILATGDGWYDYSAKYISGASIHMIPARIPESVREVVLAVSQQAHELLGCRGVTRADLRFDPETGEIALLEVNTQPGMTPTSLVPEQAQHVGIPFGELVTWLVEDASCRR